MSEKFYMAGTEGTGQYIVIAAAPLGRIGIRDLGDEVRIRLEPATAEAAGAMAPALSGWKQPDEQDRFSTVVPKGTTVGDAVRRGLAAIGLAAVEFNPAAADWEARFAFQSNSSSSDQDDDMDGDGDEPVAVQPAALNAAIASADALADALRNLRG